MVLAVLQSGAGAQAQTFTTMATFSGANGANPSAGLVQGFDGNYYGTTSYGGANNSCSSGCGEVFRITPAGAVTAIYSFCAKADCVDGNAPYAGLTRAKNGSLYGTTAWGGANFCAQQGQNCGTVFKITTKGKLTTLHSFDGTDGSKPLAAVVEGTDGNYYGTTYQGGANGSGTVFKMSAAGKLTSLYSFCSKANCADGALPRAALVEGSDGNLYGTTTAGGANCQPNGCGTVFKITMRGALTTIYSFCDQAGCADGDSSLAPLIQGADGNFYSTTYGYGGPAGGGTVFEISSAGALSAIYDFCSQPNCADGANSQGGLTLGTDGNFYGTTTGGGVYGDYGTLFGVTQEGGLSTLYTFCADHPACTDGQSPAAGLMQGTNGIFYGTTYSGGTSGYGTVFSLNTGLGAFVETTPPFGEVGAAVVILGNDLTGASAVSFNGTPATFTVVKGGTEIKTKVPSGSTSGSVTVTTPSGTLTSNVPFNVQ